MALAKEPLRTEDSIIVESGRVVESGIIADSNGLLFIEFSQNARVVVSTDRISFSGEIIPPQIIALPDKKPRARMQEIITFELLGDTAEKLLFADQFDVMNWKERVRYEYWNSGSFNRTTALVQLLVPIKEDYGKLSLWEYDYENGWTNLGGKEEESSTPGTKVFSSVLTGTGIFTLFDENPAPDFVPPFPLDRVTLVEPDPFAEEYFTENAAYSTEATPELFEGMYVDPTLPAPAVPIEGDFSNVSFTGGQGQDQMIYVEGEMPLQITGDPNRAQTPEELYAQKDAEGKIPALPLMFPGAENNFAREVVIEEPAPLLIEQSVPIPDALPQTGPADGEEKKTMFPFMILFAVVILGSSFYFAVKGKRKII